MELRGWNYTRKYWESGQEDSWKSSHRLSRRYSWALSVLVPHDETGWDWDHESNGDGSHVTVRLHWIKDKTPEAIVKTISDGWFAIFGVTSKILSDNGGEFQNEKVRRMAERWNIKLLEY